jgi:predicted nucleic acid-binding protein
MKTRPILADSNIIVYAINSSSPKHEAAQAFLQANAGLLVLAHQNVLEAFRVLTHNRFPRPMNTAAAAQAINAIAEVCRVIAPDQTAHYIALALIEEHSLTGDKIFDAYLTATAMAAGISTIATDNTKDFAAFKGVTVINPFKTGKAGSE